MSRATIQLLPEAVDDLRSLDGSARRLVAAGIEKLRTDPHLRGAPLGSRQSGDLTGFRKLVVGNRDYRIVYQVREDGTVAVLWVIAKRADQAAYELAKARIVLYTKDPQKRALLEQLLNTAFDQPPAG